MGVKSWYSARMGNVGKARNIAVVAVLVALLVSIVWRSVLSTEQIITIGFIGPLTGNASSVGIPIGYAVEIAAEVVNQNGGIKGKSIEIIFEDGACSGETAARAAQKLVHEDKARIIIGGTCSGETLRILPITEKEKVILLSPSSSSPDLTGAGKYFFRNTPSDVEGGRKLATLMIEKYGYNKIGIISEKTEYAQAFSRVFKESVEELGGEVVSDEDFAPEADDFRSMLTKIEDAGAEALFINPQTEISGGTIVKQAKEINVTSKLFASNVLSGSQSMEIAGEHIEGLVFIDGPGLSYGNTKAAAFLSEFRSKYGDPGIEFYAGAAYDAVFILAQAIEEVGMNTEKIRRYLSAMENFSGVAGTYRFNQYGDPEGINFVIKKIQDQKVVNVSD